MSVNTQEILSAYINSFTSPNSRLAYIRDLKQFQKWCKEKGITNLLQISLEHAIAYGSFLSEQFAATTVERKLAAVKGFYGEATQQGVIEKNHFIDIKGPHKEKRGKKKIPPLDEGEVERVLLYPALHTREGHRDYAMIYTMFTMGLKVGEVVNLHVDDFRPYQNGFIVYIRQAEGKGFYTKVPQLTLTVINNYIKKFGIKGFFFTSLAKNKSRSGSSALPLTPRSGWVIVKKYLKKARLSSYMRTTSCAREFFIHFMKNENVGLGHIKKMLGLTSNNAVKRYEDFSSAKKNNLGGLFFQKHPVDKIKIPIREY